MNWAAVLPVLMILLNLGASVASLVKGDSSRTVYWLAAALLNYSVTFPFPRFPWSL